MARCASCGIALSEAMPLCPHHHARDNGWAETNRIMCDFVHRGVVPPRLRTAERDEDPRRSLQEAAV
jgi:hypothetical protein